MIWSNLAKEKLACMRVGMYENEINGGHFEHLNCDIVSNALL